VHQQLIAQDQTLCARTQKLTAVTEVGARTAALRLAQMPEPSQLNRRQAAALSVARFNPILSRFYQRLRAKDKPPNSLSPAVMRKLLLALNHTLKPLLCTA
jgi:hypothetical protein